MNTIYIVQTDSGKILAYLNDCIKGKNKVLYAVVAEGHLNASLHQANVICNILDNLTKKEQDLFFANSL
jgi:hypothetical protein